MRETALREAEVAQQILAEAISEAKTIVANPKITAAEGRYLHYDLNHPLARRLTCKMMEAVADGLAGCENVLSYDIWSEPSYSKYSPLAKQKFQEALKQKYGNIERLNKVWAQASKNSVSRLPPGVFGK